MVLFSGIPKNPRCPLFLHLLFSGEVKENMTRWVRNLKIWGFGWLSIALAHFPFSWLDRTKSQPTQIKRTEHLRAHYLLISKNSPRGLPLEHLISIHLAVRLQRQGALPLASLQSVRQWREDNSTSRIWLNPATTNEYNFKLLLA